jgi:hypothetical protein
MGSVSKVTKTIHVPGDKPPLDRWRGDQVLEPNRPIWGLEAIAKVLGLSVNATRQMAKRDGVPIYKPAGSGQYFAYRSELTAWLTGQKPV